MQKKLEPRFIQHKLKDFFTKESSKELGNLNTEVEEFHPQGNPIPLFDKYVKEN
jgi:hypothetical protein